MSLPSDDTPAERREMYQEIAALVAAIAKAFDLSESEAIAALERQTVALNFAADENGNRFVLARYQGRSARLYRGAIKQESVAE